MDNTATFEIVREIGKIRPAGREYTRELNLVSWNGRPPKYDIREWNAGHSRMTKGLTFSTEELDLIIELYLKDREANG